jgi:hypothetical protein
MSKVRTPWHVYFAIFLKETAPPDIQLKFEVIFTTEPQRGDLLLLRRGDAGHRDGEATAFLGLWPHVRAHTLVEYKSLSWPLHAGDLARLQGYGAQYVAARLEEGPFSLHDLSLVLIVPTRTPTLKDELGRMGWTLTDLGKGYGRIDGSGYAMVLVVIEEVTQAEQDELLGLFSRRRWTPRQVAWFWKHHAGALEGVNVQEVEGYDQIISEMLASIPVEKRMEGLAPEQQLLALSNEVLRGLREDYVNSLPADVAAAIRARLGRSSNH